MSNYMFTLGMDFLISADWWSYMKALVDSFPIWKCGWCLVFTGTTTLHLSVQKLLSKDQVIKTDDFNIPDRSKFPPSINETGLVSVYYDSM